MTHSRIGTIPPTAATMTYRAWALVVSIAVGGGVPGCLREALPETNENRVSSSSEYRIGAYAQLDPERIPELLSPPAVYGVPSCGGSLRTELASATPGEIASAYVVPTEDRMHALHQSLAAMVAGETDLAVHRAIDAGYALCAASVDADADADVVVWRPLAAHSGDARIAIRVRFASPIMLEVPHARFELDTLDEALVVFDLLRARVLIASGAHRCAAEGESSSCSGTTSVCGDTARYRVSDQAHTERSMFHAAHIELADTFAHDWVVALHGNAGERVHISDGTRNETSEDSGVAVVATAMARAFPATDVATCNAFGDLESTRTLCGTTDVQGRHINGVDDACYESAREASGRFLHIEQPRSVRAEPHEVAYALASLLQ